MEQRVSRRLLAEDSMVASHFDVAGQQGSSLAQPWEARRSALDNLHEVLPGCSAAVEVEEAEEAVLLY